MPDSDPVRRVPVSLIVAAAENGVIGRDGELPWRLPADLARFKRLTMGRPILMGRKTYESIGRPLPGRLSIVLARDASWCPGHPGVLVCDSLDGALAAAAADDSLCQDAPAFVIGGAQVYAAALPRVEVVYLTRVHVEVDGDATFPPLDPAAWKLVSSEHYPADHQNYHATTFEVWHRVSP